MNLIIGNKQVAAPFPVNPRIGLAFEGRKRKLPPLHVVVHVDMTFSSAATEKTLGKRGLSTHFGIDGDDVNGWSTVWQWLDPMERTAAHAGDANARSIGIDVNTPLDLKYLERDAKKRDGRHRPVLKGLSVGKEREVLGLFPCQLRSIGALADVLREHCAIPMRYARDDNRQWVTGPFDGWRTWRGWMGHHCVPTTHWCPGPVGVQVAAAIEACRVEG